MTRDFDNHQLKNAKSFERYGGGVVIEEKDIKNNILTFTSKDPQ